MEGEKTLEVHFKKVSAAACALLHIIHNMSESTEALSGKREKKSDNPYPFRNQIILCEKNI